MFCFCKTIYDLETENRNAICFLALYFLSIHGDNLIGSGCNYTPHKTQNKQQFKQQLWASEENDLIINDVQ